MGCGNEKATIKRPGAGKGVTFITLPNAASKCIAQKYGAQRPQEHAPLLLGGESDRTHYAGGHPFFGRPARRSAYPFFVKLVTIAALKG